VIRLFGGLRALPAGKFLTKSREILPDSGRKCQFVDFASKMYQAREEPNEKDLLVWFLRSRSVLNIMLEIGVSALI
jgi:hypothetical protein